MKYLALDFETGNASPISACAIGLALFENNQLLFQRASLIRPPAEAGAFHWGNIKIHGIRKAQVENELSFHELWQQFRDDVENSILVCHNAVFDTMVLKALLSYYALPMPSCRFLCTVKVSRKVWPDMANHKLDTVAAALGITLNHHEAGSDAYAAGLILQRALYETGEKDADALAERIGMRLGVISPEGCIGCSTAAEVAREHERALQPPRRYSYRKPAKQAVIITVPKEEII